MPEPVVAEDDVAFFPAGFHVPPEPAAEIRLLSYTHFIHDWRHSPSVRAMTFEMRGIYREALDFAYELGSVPADDGVLRRLIGADEKGWKASWPAVKAMFFEHGGRLWNEKVNANRPAFPVRQEGRRKQAALMREAKNAK